MPITLNGSTGITHPDGTGQRGYLGVSAVQNLNAANHDFTGIPSWARRVSLIINGMSTNGTSLPIFRLGAGAVQNTGYAGSASNTAPGATASSLNTTGALLAASWIASSTLSAVIRAELIASNLWVISGVGGFSDTASNMHTGSVVTLSGTLDRVRLTTVNGTDLFDAGSAIAMWE